MSVFKEEIVDDREVVRNERRFTAFSYIHGGR